MCQAFDNSAHSGQRQHEAALQQLSCESCARQQQVVMTAAEAIPESNTPPAPAPKPPQLVPSMNNLGESWSYCAKGAERRTRNVQTHAVLISR